MKISKEEVLESYVLELTKEDTDFYLSDDAGYICHFMERCCSRDVLQSFHKYLKENKLVNTSDRGINYSLGITFHDDFEVYQSIRYMVLEHFLDWLDKRG